MFRINTRQLTVGAILIGAVGVALARSPQVKPPLQDVSLKPWQEVVEVSRLSDTFMKLMILRGMAKEPGGLERVKLLTKTDDAEARKVLEFAESIGTDDELHSRTRVRELCAKYAQARAVEEVADALTKLDADERAHKEQLVGNMSAKLGSRLAAKVDAYVAMASPSGKKALRTQWREWFDFHQKSPREALPTWCSKF